MALRPAICGALVVSIAIALISTSPLAQTPQQAPVFRAGVTLVPIDVRVLDRSGKPITDLKAEDFRILEDGVPQPIRHFSAQPVTAGTPDAAVLPRRTAESSGALAPQNRRLFLIVLGRGRLQEPSKGLDALLRFVRERLLPQDQVALMAWNRATDFTTDHAKIAGVIARFRAKHEEIEGLLRGYYTGLAGLYAGRKLPASAQARIDEIFSDPLAGGTRETLSDRAITPAEVLAQRTAQDLAARSGIEAFRQFGGTDNALADLMAGDTFGLNFDDYVALSRQTLQDVGNLYAGIDYLRFIDGEKHLIFVTEQGFALPSADYDRDLAALASDARVAIDTIQTGGVHTVLVDNMPVIPASNTAALSALRTVSEMSGGQVAISTHAEAAFDRILNSTGFGYLLGYSPANSALDGRFRRLKVEVTRRNVTVHHRRGYFNRAQPEHFDPRRSLATTRISTAANYQEDVRDLDVSIKVNEIRRGDLRTIVVDARVLANNVIFANIMTAQGARHLAALNVAVFCTDQYGADVGELWKTLDITLPPEGLSQARTEGLKFSLDVPVSKRPRFVKLVVYDYGSDRIGSKYTRLN